jgi:beta-glucosidase/6-phospho-beta-glucosidase/beta-galactosidase
MTTITEQCKEVNKYRVCIKIVLKENYFLSGEVGITLDSGWTEPKTQKPEDIEAAERARQFKVFRTA